MFNAQRFLILAPHTDDGEFGCGGTIAKLINAKKDVFYVAFSSCEKSLLPGQNKDVLITELYEATQVLGIARENVEVKKFDVRCFERDRQEILDEIISLNRRIKPDVVFIPSPHDLHQDHQTIAAESLRAFKLSATILGYEMPWNNLTFNTTCFIPFEEKALEKKIQALSCYKSQQNRFYAKESFIKSLAITRGVQIGCEFAETFEVLRWIVL